MPYYPKKKTRSAAAKGKRKRDVSKDSSALGSDDESDVTDTRKKVRWTGRSTSVASTVPDQELPEEPDRDSDRPDSSNGSDSLIQARDKICLTSVCQNGRAGFAYYDPLQCVIFVLEDTEETKHYDLTKMIIDQADPDVVLTSSRSDELFVDVVREYLDEKGGIFQIRPHKEFSSSKGQERLLSLELLSELPSDLVADLVAPGSEHSDTQPRNAYDFMMSRRETEGDPNAKRWNAGIRVSNFTSTNAPLCLSSVGALIDYLVRERAMSDLEDESIRGLEVRSIATIALSEVMQINADALASLQIFENESHASVHTDKTKEGLSLYGILNTTKTTQGQSLLKAWLLRPSLSLPVVQSRHDAVACLIRPENLGTVSAFHAHLKGIKNVPRILGFLKAGRAKLADWQGLVKFAFHCAMLKDALAELHMAEDVGIIRKVISALDVASFTEVGRRVNDIIDWEESAEAGRVCVRHHIDEELDNRKHVYYGIDSVLSKVAEQIGQKVSPNYARELNIVYFPQLGFLICIPMLDEWKGEGGVPVNDGWIFQFSSESHVYFKSQEMHDMDTHIGDLHSLIVDREIEIVQELLEAILIHVKNMNDACDILAELDCLLSFADAARTYGYVRPTMVEANIIEIRQGRHPLQELIVDTFIPNNARIGELGNSDDEYSTRKNMVICTGANACGKSVYLKQIALIQYMAQIGCFVPAECATLGLVDKSSFLEVVIY